MVDKTVDLITGSPLLQETDFELPFGAAVFRHVRTYSEPTGFGQHEEGCLQEGTRPSSYYWDWNGQGWMTGENPFFLIDAAYWGWSAQAGERRCYFIPDAHHAIPFVMHHNDTTHPVYEAPARFDAVLSYEDGTWNPATQSWTTPPTKWFVWLQNQSVKYTIEPRYEDVGYSMRAGVWASFHDAPPIDRLPNTDTGWGIPYYGLVTQIADRFGNHADIRYCEFHQDPCGSTTGCQYCCQNCYEKGQIRSVKLYAAGCSTAAWTLLYAHRGFQQDVPYWDSTGTMIYPHHRQQAIHAIYVFHTDLPVDQTTACPTIPFERFQATVDQVLAQHEGLATADVAREALATAEATLDPFAELPGVFQSDWANLWDYQVRYLYTDKTWVFAGSPGAPTYLPNEIFAPGPTSGNLPQPFADETESPRLLKTSVRQRMSGGSSPTFVDRHTLYRHRLVMMEPSAAQDRLALDAIWRPDQLAAIRSGIVQDGQTGPHYGMLADWPLGLLTSSLYESFTIPNTPAPYNYVAGAWRSERFDNISALSLHHWQAPGTYNPYGDYDDATEASCFFNELVSQFTATIEDKTKLITQATGVSTFIDRESGNGPGSFHKVYRFFVRPPQSQYPWGTQSSASCGGQTAPYYSSHWSGGPTSFRAISHHPYMYIDTYNETNGLSQANIVDASEPLWLTVVDTYDSELGLHPELPRPPDDPHGWPVGQYPQSQHYYPTIASMPQDDPRRPLSRRVVLMNAAGNILDEGFWILKGDMSGSGGYGPGLRNLCFYDDQQRIKEKRTPSWRAADSQGVNDGLIYIYKYDDRTVGTETTYAQGIGAIGIKQGTNGTINWLAQFFHTNTDRPELLTHEVQYITPPTGSDPPSFNSPPTVSTADVAVKITDYVLVQPPNTTLPREKRVSVKKTARPPTAGVPGLTPMYPLSMEAYDDKGLLRWRAYGAVQSYVSPGTSGDELYLDKLDYDDPGRLHTEAIDVASVPADPNGAYPAGPTRQCARNPLNQTTTYTYSGDRLSRIDFPNGRSEFHTYFIWHSGWFTGNTSEYFEEHIFKDMLPSGSGWKAMGPGTVNRHNNVSPDWDGISATLNEHPYGTNASVYSAMVQWPDLSTDPTGNETYTVLAELTPQFSPSGTLSGWTIGGSDGASLSGTVSHTHLGEIERTQGPDGTVTRLLSDAIGRPLKTFRGAADLHPYWRTLPPDAQTFDDNMLLLDKRYYGTGLVDYNPGAADFGNTGKVIETRRYRQKIDDQYPLSTHTGPYQEDQKGWAEEHRYDWRGRDVWTLQYAAGETKISNSVNQNPTVLRQTMTWFDEQDRVRFVAVFGGDTLTMNGLESWAGNPTHMTPGYPIPDAGTIIGMRAKRLTETRYNVRGLVEQTREYDCGWVSSTGNPNPPYLLSETYYGFRDTALYSRSAGSGVQTYLYDARGHQISSASSILDTSGNLSQVSRTDTTQISPEGNAEIVVRWERRHDGTGNVLDTSNAIATYAYNWFDSKNRLIASAAVGTGTTSFTNATPPARPQDAPVVFSSIGEFVAFDWDSATAGVQPPPAGVQVSATHYNLKDEKDESISPDGRVTSYYYNSLGAVTLQIENALGTMAQRRPTASKYVNGKLVKMGAIANPSFYENWEDGTNSQVTQVDYGADIYGEDQALNATNPISHNGGFVGAVRFPDKATGVPSDNPGLSFTYYPDGLLRSRTDGRGIKVTHHYDELGNRVHTDIDYSQAQYPANLAPVDQIVSLDYQYETATGLLLRAKAWTPDTANQGQFVLVSDNQFLYDSRGNLLTEIQSHGTAVTTNSPRIDFTRAYAPAAGSETGSIAGGYDFDRLISMIYPAKPGTGTRRTISLDCGDTLGSLDGVLGRVTRMSTTNSGSSFELSRYAYAGTDRRVNVTLGYVTGALCAAAQTFAGSGGYPGLDGLGRVQDLNYVQGSTVYSGTTLERWQYGYDAAGNRAAARVTQRAGSGGGALWDNQRSWLYGYDGLERLTGSDLGALDSSNTTIGGSTQIPSPRLESWTLDNLGNWKGDGSTPGRVVAGPSTVRTTHTTDKVNQATQVTTDAGSGTTPASVGLYYDRSGNLALDESYFYQYDAWNRLVGVRNRGSLTVNQETGEVNGGSPGGEIARFSYDALGRVTRKLSPYPGQAGQWRTEHYYYDGVRRIQEVFTDPMVVAEAFTSKDEAEEIAPGQVQTEGTPGTSQVISGTPPPAGTWCEREYAWDPSVGAYVDACVAQFDAWGRTGYVIQDANYDVAALVDPNGNPIVQYGWDPYGEVLFRESFGVVFGDNRLGHQGLYFDRLDADCLQTQITATVLSSTPHRGLYQNRNRSYDPHLGRFIQRDPNGSGLGVLGGTASTMGLPAYASNGEFHLRRLYANGMNSYGYLGAGPTMSSDPMGTFFGIAGFILRLRRSLGFS